MPKNTTLIAGLIGLALTGCAMAQGAMPAGVADTSKRKALVDARGMSLCSFDKDGDGQSACNGPCAQNWPAFKATAAAQAAPSGWSSVTREDGTKQWAYKGKPLYTFAKDTGPADVKGDGFLNGAWHIAQP